MIRQKLTPIKRLKNPIFIAAVAGFIYQLLQYSGIQFPDNLFKTAVDIVSYILIGTGVYSTFETK